MRFNFRLIEKISKETPRTSVLKWIYVTLLYGFAITINDHFELIEALGLPGRFEAYVKLSGVYLYIVLTAYSFYKTKKNENIPDYNKVTSDLAHDAKRGHFPVTKRTKIDKQGNKLSDPQSDNVATQSGATANADRSSS